MSLVKPPPKIRHSPVAWSETVYATGLYQFVLQYAIAKCNLAKVNRLEFQLALGPLALQNSPVPRSLEVDSESIYPDTPTSDASFDLSVPPVRRTVINDSIPDDGSGVRA